MPLRPASAPHRPVAEPRPRRPVGAGILLAALTLLAACATPPRPLEPAESARLAALLPTDLLLLGEQHDAPAHQQLERQVVDWLAARGELAAVALEMAAQGHATTGLPRQASEAEVRAALDWQDAAWPWASYGPVVMAAVRAGVPVLGANLPRPGIRAAMADGSLEARLPPAALAEQHTRIREGHCNALPESQIGLMTRVQIARDLSMAQTLAKARDSGRVVLLVTGNGHVHRQLGVPWHLPADLKVKVLSAGADTSKAATKTEASTALSEAGLARGDQLWPTPPAPARDHCAAFRAKP
jgi:uncharacterized iron-regulated protein